MGTFPAFQSQTICGLSMIPWGLYNNQPYLDPTSALTLRTHRCMTEARGTYPQKIVNLLTSWNIGSGLSFVPTRAAKLI